MDAPRLPKDGDKVVVTLIAPVVIMMNAQPKRVIAIEGELSINTDKYVVFRAMRLLSVSGTTPTFATMKVDITVTHANIAGLIPAPQPVQQRPGPQPRPTATERQP